MRHIRSVVEQVRLGQRHAPVDFRLILDDLPDVVVQSGADAHPAREFAQLVVTVAHGLERGAAGRFAWP
jgi:hypothetical protein